MSEYQYYEFQAIDQPLDKEQMAELRAVSTRATITPTWFENHYHWSGLKADPKTLLAKYFDAFLYFANWGTRRLMFRLPQHLLDLEAVSPYCAGYSLQLREHDPHVILDFITGAEGGEWDWDEDEAEPTLSPLLPLRADLAAGDLRGLYLGWLLCAQNGELEDDEQEPLVPPGLGELSASLVALAEFLRIDQDLITVAAERSPVLKATTPDRAALEKWIRDLPGPEKDAMLLRVVEGQAPHLGAELLRRFREAHATGEPAAGGRTVLELLESAEVRTEVRERELAEREARERARREAEAAAQRAKYLDLLAPRQEELWRKVEALIETKIQKHYDEAVGHLKDLRDLAAREGRSAEFGSRLGELRERHARKPSLMARLDNAWLVPDLTVA